MAVIRVSHGEFVMAAAPYRGEAVTEVFDEDPDYVYFLLKGELSSAELQVLAAVVDGDELPDVDVFGRNDDAE